jgi:hypothetical protein
MGGNAIQNARRINKAEFDQIIEELRSILPELNFSVVKAYRQKPDFGDIDLVVTTSPTVNQKQLIRDRLQPTDEYDNGPFFSVEYKGVQVDFIFMHESEAQAALHYFHWNDLGNFIGRVARSLNFKYGHDGLSYDKHYSDHYKISVPVSKDTKKILEFLGYDYNVWLHGFEEKNDIFEYAMSTPYFNATYFSLEEQAHNDRVRNRKRKMYQSMLEHIQAKGVEGKPKLSQEEREAHFQRAITFFNNGFEKKVEEEKAKYDLSVKVKELFNGDIVSKLTGMFGKHSGLTGKELGQFIQKIKSSEPDLNSRILAGGPSFVEELVKKYIN